MNAFYAVPKKQFMAQMLGPVAGVFFLGIIIMGIVADPETFQPKPIKTSGALQSELPVSLQGASRGGIKHWETTVFFATHIPEVCWGDNAVNDFQKKQCDDFWDHLEMGAGLSLLPFAMAWLVFQMAMGSLATVYRRGRKRLDAAKPISRGTVTNPASAPGDLFSRFYCFRAISVQLAGGKQIKVYVPLDSPMPSPGLTMAIFEPISFFGEPRHFAMIYAPHVAVVSGVRHG
jgi:hypothetical protein